ncbi:MAG: prolyl oligopeptidase family serine peptidase [Blastocatellia bacterium]
MNRREFCWITAASFGGITVGITLGQTPKPSPVPEIDLFEAKTFKSAGGVTLPYRLFVPKNYNAKKGYPLVLWLHGFGGRGTDNLMQMSYNNGSGAAAWVKAEIQAKNPCIVIAPQGPGLWSALWLSGVYELIESLQKTFSIEANRLYVAGWSAGGMGTWALVAEHPDNFAAAVPLSSSGDVRNAPKLTKLPIWAFHGDKDPEVNVAGSRRMVEAIKQAGGHPKYTEYAGAGHTIVQQVFSEPDLMPWVFAQRRAVR